MKQNVKFDDDIAVSRTLDNNDAENGISAMLSGPQDEFLYW